MNCSAITSLTRSARNISTHGFSTLRGPPLRGGRCFRRKGRLERTAPFSGCRRSRCCSKQGTGAGRGTMRKLALGTVLGCFGLLSCATTIGDAHVAARDYTTGIFMVCGDDGLPQENLNARAATVCTGVPTPRILRCADHVTGSSSYSFGHFGGSTEVVGNCCEYQCPIPAEVGQPPTPPQAPPASK
jgi:hypothetical protein